MHTPTWNGYAHVALAAGLLVVSTAVLAVSRRGWVGPVGILMVVAFHPSWTIQPGQEREFSKRQMGTAASVVAGTLFLGQAVWVGWAYLRRAPTGVQVDDYGDDPRSPARPDWD